MHARQDSDRTDQESVATAGTAQHLAVGPFHLSGILLVLIFALVYAFTLDTGLQPP